MRTHLLLALALALLAILAAEASPVNMARRDIITALPESADAMELKFQPKLDFDTDGCYNTAAISPNGLTNPGRGATITLHGRCRDPSQLRNSNVYSRKRCNNGYCAIMYEYYFEKDQAVWASFLGGHRHEWENVIVFVQGNDRIVRVATSCHFGFSHASSQFPVDGTHPLVVYHKHNIRTHCFRPARSHDIAHPENFSGAFYRSPLVGWNSWPSVALRDTMLRVWDGEVGPKLDDEFGGKLKQAAGDGVPGFDPYLDA